MFLSRRSFLKHSAQIGAAALTLTCPLTSYATSLNEMENYSKSDVDKAIDSLKSIHITQASSEDDFLRIELLSASRMLFSPEADLPCILSLSFKITNLTGDTVWLYHRHGNMLSEFYDGSRCITLTLNDTVLSFSFNISDKLEKRSESLDEMGSFCLAYGIKAGETISVGASGSIGTDSGTLEISFTPPEQHGTNTDAHNSVYTFELEFSEPLDPSCTSMQITDSTK